MTISWQDTPFQPAGWSEDPVDICWMACNAPGYSRTVAGHEIVLCKSHIEEIEQTDLESRVQKDGWWPWRKLDDDKFTATILGGE